MKERFTLIIENNKCDEVYSLVKEKIVIIDDEELVFSEMVCMTTSYQKAQAELNNDPSLYIKKYLNA